MQKKFIVLSVFMFFLVLFTYPVNAFFDTGIGSCLEDPAFPICLDMFDDGGFGANYTNNSIYFAGHLPSYYLGVGGISGAMIGAFVNITGDVMTGSLNLTTGNIQIGDGAANSGNRSLILMSDTNNYTRLGFFEGTESLGFSLMYNGIGSGQFQFRRHDNDKNGVVTAYIERDSDEWFFVDNVSWGGTAYGRLGWGNITEAPAFISGNYSNDTVYFGGHLPAHYLGGGGISDAMVAAFVNITGDTMSGILNGTDFCLLTGICLSNITSSTTYLPTVNTTYRGTWTGGNITSISNLQEFPPTNYDWYNVTEATGVDPSMVIINFSSVSSFSNLIFRLKYIGGQGHEILVSLYDYDLNTWEEEYGELTDMANFATINVYIPDSDRHVSGTGDVALRFRHEQNGIPGHYLYIDYVSLVDGFTSITTTNHDGLSGRDSPDNHPWAVAAAGDVMTGDLNISTGNTFVNISTSGVINTSGGNITFGTFPDLFVDVGNMRVGVGTAEPNNRFQVLGLINFDDANSNVFLGIDVFANESGSQNLGLGFAAGQNNDVSTGGGINNIYIGYNSGKGATAGANNTGSGNTGVGANTLEMATSGKDNVGIGFFALRSVTSGSDNIAIGKDALKTNQGGVGCVGIGTNALEIATTCSSNFALGKDVMKVATSADNTVAIGSLAMDSVVTGDRNIGIGTWALRKNVDGDYNTCIGDRACTGATGNSPYRNVAIGKDGLLVVSTGTDNTVIGYLAGDSITTGSSNILIGSGVDATTPTRSNFMNIANLIFANISDGLVGIGESNPEKVLTVHGLNMTIYEGTGYVNVSNGNINMTGNLTAGLGTVFIDGTQSRIGIGTVQPKFPFHYNRTNYTTTAAVAPSFSLCYQEKPTIAPADACGGLATGGFLDDITVPDSYDGDWDTSANPSGSTFLINYTIPAQAVNGGSMWQVKDGCRTANESIPAACWDHYPGTRNITFRVGDAGDITQIQWDCWDGSWQELDECDSSAEVYEEAMYWNLTSGNSSESSTIEGYIFSIDNESNINMSGTINASGKGNNTFDGDMTIKGTLYGGSDLKVGTGVSAKGASSFYSGTGYVNITPATGYVQTSGSINIGSDLTVGDAITANSLTAHGNIRSYSGAGYVNITATTGSIITTGDITVGGEIHGQIDWVYLDGDNFYYDGDTLCDILDNEVTGYYYTCITCVDTDGSTQSCTGVDSYYGWCACQQD